MNTLNFYAQPSKATTCLQYYVGFANMTVVKSDIDSGAPPLPSAPFKPSATPDEIHEMSLDALQAYLEDLLPKAMPGRGSEDRAADGSPCVPSLVAVCLISMVEHAAGKRKLVSLANVQNKDDLKSVRGVVKLLHGGLDELRSVKVAQ